MDRSRIVAAHHAPEKKERARQLRREMTPAETVLWGQLRAGRLGGVHFRRQQIIDGFIADFYCHAAGLVIEIDGDVHATQVEADKERERVLTARRLRVLRFTNSEIADALPTCLAAILAATNEGDGPNPPAPFPKRKGEQGTERSKRGREDHGAQTKTPLPFREGGRGVGPRSIGNPDLLHGDLLALVCSRQCPGQLIVQAYDLAVALREAGVAVVGGFQSPMEAECLALLLRGSQPVVICPSRSIAAMRVPQAWKAPLEAGRLLVLSPFPEHARRMTRALGEERNRFVVGLARAVFAIHAAPGSKTEQLCREVRAAGTPLWTLPGDANANLLALGAHPLAPGEIAGMGWRPTPRPPP